MLIELVILGGGAVLWNSLKRHKAGQTNKQLTKKKNAIRKLFYDNRHKQLEELSSSSKDIATTEQDKKLHNTFIVGLISFGFAISGLIFYPPLSILSLPGILYGTHHIYKDAYFSITQKRKINIDVLNAGVITILIVSGYYIFACLRVVLAVLRQKLVSKVKDDSKGAIIDVFSHQPRSVTILIGNLETSIPFKELTSNDVVVVNAGDTISVDGYILNGILTVDEHILTGEAVPVEKETGDQVFALTVALSGRVEIQVEKTGQETTAAQIGQILNQTVHLKTNMQLESERVIDMLVLPTLLIGGTASPFIGASNAAGFINSLPGDNLVIATAVNTLTFLNLMSKHGILVKDGRVLELLNQVDTIVFDKTGTLTQEQPQVGKIYVFNGYESSDVLYFAAAAERYQHHPIAKAILSEVNILDLPEIKEADYKIGFGLTVTISNRKVYVGSHRFMELSEIDVPDKYQDIQVDSQKQGYSLLFVAIDHMLAGIIELQPTIRPEAKEVIHQLRQHSIKSMYIISGDHHAPTQSLANTLDIEHYFAETSPECKADIIEQLQNEGKVVCYVGDGINDSIALKKAHVSISLRGASTIATDTAQVILMDSSLAHLAKLFKLAEDFKSQMHFTYASNGMPNILGIGAILLLHTGFLTSIIMNQTGLILSMINAILPLIKHEKNKNDDS